MGAPVPVVSGVDLALWLILLLIIVVGGRVLPMFTSNGPGGVMTLAYILVNAAAVLRMLAVAMDSTHWTQLIIAAGTC